MTVLNELQSRVFRNPDVLGELLRELAFVPDEWGGDYGCYSTFEVAPEFAKVDPDSELGRKILLAFARVDGYDVMLDESDETYQTFDKLTEDEMLAEFVADQPGVRDSLYSAGDVHMAFYWNGDGTLFFVIPSMGKCLENGDCKKSYGWRFHNWKE